MNKHYLITVNDTSDETILNLLEFGTIDIISENEVRLLANAGIKNQIEKCKNVLKVMK